MEAESLGNGYFVVAPGVVSRGGLLHGVQQVAGGRQKPEVTAVLGTWEWKGAHEPGAHELGRVQERSAFPPAVMEGMGTEGRGHEGKGTQGRYR